MPLQLLRSKWATGKARRGRIPSAGCNRAATPPLAYFQRNPKGCGSFSIFPRCSLGQDRSGYCRSLRLEKSKNSRQQL